MKNLMYLFLIVFITACSKPKQYSITGKISNYSGDMVFLNKIIDGALAAIDSVSSVNGEFVFKGSVEAPEMFYLTINGTSNELAFFIDNSNISITASSENLEEGTIAGSQAHNEYLDFLNEEEQFNTKMDSIGILYDEAKEIGDDSKVKELEDAYWDVYNKKTAFIKYFITKQNNSFISPYLLYRKLIYSIELNELDSLTANFAPSLNKSPYIKLLKNRIEILKNVDIGQPFVEIELNDTSGTPISLSSLKGNYILIDFWASWCPPCRVENPNVVELYNKYKNKGFEVFGVSLDSKKSKWIKAIKEDKIPYTQVSELNGWKCSFAKKYGVNSIPHTVLLDRDGIIIAKNIREGKLIKKISELLD